MVLKLTKDSTELVLIHSLVIKTCSVLAAKLIKKTIIFGTMPDHFHEAGANCL